MASTGESDKKRRHVCSTSPTAASAKKHSFFPASDDKKLDTAVLKYQNQKLAQQLEIQKAESFALESKCRKLEDQQKSHDDTIKIIRKYWETLLDEAQSLSFCTRASATGGSDEGHSPVFAEEAFLHRLVESGATDRCSVAGLPDRMQDDTIFSCPKIKDILENVLSTIVNTERVRQKYSSRLLEALPDDEFTRETQKIICSLETEVRSLHMALRDLHLTHRSLRNEVQRHHDIEAKNKVELKHLSGEIETTASELEECNKKLSSLKAEGDARRPASFPFINLGSKCDAGDKARVKEQDFQQTQSILNELTKLSSDRLAQLSSAHGERINVLKKLVSLQNSLKNTKFISSSKIYMSLKDQIEKSKTDVARCQTLLEKLQIDKNKHSWREKETSIKIRLMDISQNVLVASNSRISELDKEIHLQKSEARLIESKTEEALKETGRKAVITEFRELVSSLPKKMNDLQNQLNQYKESALKVHSLRAEVRSLSSILNRKVNESNSLSGKCAVQVSEIEKMKTMVYDLRVVDKELKLFLSMYQRSITDSRDVVEARDSENKAWAQVQHLRSMLDEHNLELRVKAANETEALSQQKLAAAEAEIAELRQKLDASTRDVCNFTKILKSKYEEGEAYLSEMETIGQAYEDMQTQNQQLLQQITERDDYNIKLVLEGVRGRHLQNATKMEKKSLERQIHQANKSVDQYKVIMGEIEEQLKICTEHLSELSEEGRRNLTVLQSKRSKLAEIETEVGQLKPSLEESQCKVEKSRLDVLALQITLEHERFNRRRSEELVETLTMKATCLSARMKGPSLVEKLQKEVAEYREILKCTICHDRQKDVVITKCCHLFCAPCIQRVTETRQRRCPICAANFNMNDVKNVYL